MYVAGMGISSADSLQRVAILYPEVSQSYSKMFEQLIEGIESVGRYEYHRLRVSNTYTSEELSKWSQTQKIDAYISLGQTTYTLVEAMNQKKTLVAGGMVATPPGITGISLSADVEAFFRNLQLLNPSINRVFFIYSEKNNGWQIRRARQISRQYGIEFVPLIVDSMHQASLQYRIVLKSMNAENDALWMPLDNIAPMQVLMPEILKYSWKRRLTVFSNNIQHARRGLMFALYPDHYQQGRRLVALLKRHIDSPTLKDELYPSVDLNVAVNIRTATHLGLRYDDIMVKSFDQIFPAFNY